jgi:hypothetical protein
MLFMVIDFTPEDLVLDWYRLFLPGFIERLLMICLFLVGFIVLSMGDSLYPLVDNLFLVVRNGGENLY